MSRWLVCLRITRRSRLYSICKHLIKLTLGILVLIYIILKIKLLTDYQHAQVFYQTQEYQTCPKDTVQNKTRPKLILFWTKIFGTPIDVDYINQFYFTSTGHCKSNQCQITNDRKQTCQSDALIFHARGRIEMDDMPKARLAHQRYVLLTKEPPYKTTAIVGHLNYFFNWTATYRLDSDIDYRYFRWLRKSNISSEVHSSSYLNNRQARAASMVSNCYSQDNREEYLERLQSIIPITRVGYCSGNKCQKTRSECLNDLAQTHPFYLAFENSLCRDYVTEKYANVLTNNRMIPIVFSQSPHLYIPNSYIHANDFSSPEDLGAFLLELVRNQTIYDNYFRWKNEYDLIIPNDNDYLCELCRKLNNPQEPVKVYESMKQWLYDDATCQRWMPKLNRTVNISVEETMDYEEPWF